HGGRRKETSRPIRNQSWGGIRIPTSRLQGTWKMGVTSGYGMYVLAMIYRKNCFGLCGFQDCSCLLVEIIYGRAPSFPVLIPRSHSAKLIWHRAYPASNIPLAKKSFLV